MDVQTIQKNFQQQKQNHIPCGYSVSTKWAFDNIENKHTLYCWEDWMKKFCRSFRENATNATNFEKNKNVKINRKS